MGLASKDPGMLSVNVTFSPTFAGASTSGTSGCKKWKFSAQVRQEFVESQWAQLREASAQGRGAHLAVFSNVMGCGTEGLHVFSQMMKSNYKRLYQDQKNRRPHLRAGQSKSYPGDFLEMPAGTGNRSKKESFDQFETVGKPGFGKGN